MNKEQDYEFDHLQRFLLYKAMLAVEPRMWTREHHMLKMMINSFTINATIFTVYKIYYKLYNPSIGFVESLMTSNKMKVWFLATALLNYGTYYFNNKLLDKVVYHNYYSHLSSKDFYMMYESMMRNHKMKNMAKDFL